MRRSRYAGARPRAEIRTFTARELGDTLLMWDRDSRLAGFAVCHWGPPARRGQIACSSSSARCAPGPGAAERFDALLNAAGALAVASGMNTLFAGVNLSRDEAYRQMIGRGFRSQAQIVTLHRPNAPGYSRPGVYVLDDWR